jgi:GDPmannose 4,6-dehydratase
MTRKKALIFGVTGQDGSYLAEILLEKGYEVHGMYRKSATGNLLNIQHLINVKNFFLHRGDMLDHSSLFRIINNLKPNEIYNEADQDHVGWSYDMVTYSSNITSTSVAFILETIKQLDTKIKFFQPCSSNMYGITSTKKQNEKTPFNPQSPYAIAKTSAYFFTKYYRENYNLHASVGILFNHESPRRSPEYVTRKITQSVARISLNKQKELVLGDISTKIDWGYARDYMYAAWQMLQQECADDYVIGSGCAASIEDIIKFAFDYVNLDYRKYVKSSKIFFRPTKTSTLISDTTKARKQFNFKSSMNLKELIEFMVEEDIKLEKIK